MSIAIEPRIARPTHDVESLGLEPGARVNEVLIGRNKTLFLAGGSHSVFEIVSGRLPIPRHSLAIFLDNIRARTAWAAERRVPYRHLVFPDKQSVVPEEWPFESCVRLGAAFCDEGRKEDLPLLYPAGILASRKHRTISRIDTHVTHYGSILAAAALVESLLGTDESETSERLTACVTGSERRFGDLGCKLDPPVSAQEPAFVGRAPGRVLTNGMKGGNNGGIDIRLNPDPVHDRRLVLFGDSFGRDICTFLQHWFREVIFLRSGFFHPELAAQLSPDLLVTENVERYLDNCLADADRPEFLLFPLLGGLELAPSEGFAAAFSALLASERPPYHRFAMGEFGRVPKGPACEESPALAATSAWSGSVLDLIPSPPETQDRDVFEPVALVVRKAPAFIVNLSGTAPPTGNGSLQDIHASILVRRRDVLLFGPSIQVARDGRWACESESFTDQFMDFFRADHFAAVFPGPKPAVTRAGDGYRLSTETLAPQDIRVVEEPVFLATPLEPGNWGRWVATVIPKLHHFAEYGGGRKFFCYTAFSWQRATLLQLGLEPHRLLEHDPGATYLCRDLMTIDYSVTNMTVSQGERLLFARIRQDAIRRLSAVGKTPQNAQRIFISRLGRSVRHPNYRVLQNESELIGALAQLGFSAVEPETLPFDEQVALFGSADVVVCLGGAALYSSVFCRPGTLVVTIESSFSFFEPHTNLLASLPLRFGVVIGVQDPDDPSAVHKRWTVDVEAVVQAVRTAMERDAK